MKKLLGFLIPVCIISFIGFGVTSLILPSGGYSVGSPIYENGTYIVNDVVEHDRDWTISDVVPVINLNSSGVTTIVNQHDGTNILVRASVPSGRQVYVSAYCDGDELTIETSRNNVTFSDVVESFGKVLWSEDIFTYSDGVVVTISFPKNIYDNVNIKLGSGELYVEDLYARDDDIKVGSGTLEMCRNQHYVSENFILNIGSGNVKIKDYHADNFDFDLGSGKFEFSGLEGSGNLDMGSGKCSLIATENLSTFSADIGSGKFELYVLENGAQVTSSVGSGSVNINAYGVEKKLGISDNDDDNSVVVGNGQAVIDIDLGSGKATVLPLESAPDIQINIPKTAVTDTASSELQPIDSVVVTE